MSQSGRTIELTAAQALVRYLAAQHTARDGAVRRLFAGIFGIFGHGNVHGIGQALVQNPDLLRFYAARNEQAMVHLAAAYAKSERRLSTFACTASIGPGATNMVTGAALSTVNRLPVLLLPADTFSNRLQGPVLQQLEMPSAGDTTVNDAFRVVSRYFDRITRPEQLLEALPEACRVLTSPAEAGAVVLSLPQDVQTEAYAFPAQFFEHREWEVARRPPAAAEVARVVALLEEAERPVVIAGGGVRYSEAEVELREFAIAFEIPVAETFAGKGSLQNGSWLCLGGMGTSGNPAANRLLSEADLVICLGTRLTDSQTASRSLFQDPDVRFVSVNVDDRDAHKLNATPVVADIRETLRALNGRANRSSRPGYREHVERITTEWHQELEAVVSVSREPLAQCELVRALNDFAVPGDIVIGASGTLPTDLLKTWDATTGKDCYLEFGFSCMTHEIPAGIGVRLSKPEGDVYVLVGDGSFLMNPTEILTAVQLGLSMTIVVVENHGFRSIHGLQLQYAGLGDLGNEFRTLDVDRWRYDGAYLEVDLAKIAEGLGARVFRAGNREEFEHALTQARDLHTVSVVVAEVDHTVSLPWSEAWREIPPAEVFEDPDGATRRATYATTRSSQRFYD
jgi:3D-(3,5/4)-trihydroxycyclohexane-1,2-dione acylhydrolase (decyclizing)